MEQQYFPLYYFAIFFMQQPLSIWMETKKDMIVLFYLIQEITFKRVEWSHVAEPKNLR